jgi:RNA polymerase sigma-70 factor (ECF subfamily)
MRQAGQRVDIDDVAQELATPAGGADQVLDLQRCLGRLPAEQREVLLLVTLQDLTYEEVARITGTPIGTVMSRLSRARARLRELMHGTPTVPQAVVPLKRMK